VTPLYLVEWEWDQLNELLMCPDRASLVQTSVGLRVPVPAAVDRRGEREPRQEL